MINKPSCRPVLRGWTGKVAATEGPVVELERFTFTGASCSYLVWSVVHRVPEQLLAASLFQTARQRHVHV